MRRAASPRRVRGRFSRTFFLMATLVAVGLLAACGNDSFLSVRDSTALAGTSEHYSDLDQAGYRNAGIHLESGSGLPADGLVDVSYSDGPAANAETDVYSAERIVWNTLRYRFGVLTVSQTSGESARGSVLRVVLHGDREPDLREAARPVRVPSGRAGQNIC